MQISSKDLKKLFYTYILKRFLKNSEKQIFHFTYSPQMVFYI